MICITCSRVFNNRPVRYYFCSPMCWENAKANTAWRILAQGWDPSWPPVKLTTTAYFPKPLESRRSASTLRDMSARLAPHEPQAECGR